MQKKRFLFAHKTTLGLFFLLLACVQPGFVLAQSYPSWFLNPAPVGEDRQRLYGYGEGNSLKQAKDSALADLSLYLNSKVESQNYTKDTLYKGDQMSNVSVFEQNIQVKSKAILYQGAKVDLVDRFERSVFVRMELEIAPWANNLKQVIRTYQSNADQLLKSQSWNNAERLQRTAVLLADRYQAQEGLKLLIGLNNLQLLPADQQFSLEQTQKDLAQIEQNIQTQIAQGVYLVDLPDQKLSGVKQQFISLLHKDYIRTTDTGAEHYDGVFRFFASFVESDLFGAKKVNGTLHVQFVDTNNVELMSANFAVQGLSANTFDAAKQKAVEGWFARQTSMMALLYSQN